jgi:tryptophan synthase alpha chain
MGKSKPARDRVPAVPRTGEDRIAAAFALRSGAAALMPYVMGGFPDMTTSRAIGEAYAANGADLVELGVPYSDPLADGPVIHAAATAALRAGAKLDGVLEVGAALSQRLPVVLMCYVNLVLARGAERFAAALREAGVSGLIVPDLPLHESDEIRRACDTADVALVALVTPTTPADRLAKIVASARGFVYVVSVVGTTGERAARAPPRRPPRRPRPRGRRRRRHRGKPADPRSGRGAGPSGRDGRARSGTRRWAHPLSWPRAWVSSSSPRLGSSSGSSSGRSGRRPWTRS